MQHYNTILYHTLLIIVTRITTKRVYECDWSRRLKTNKSRQQLGAYT